MESENKLFARVEIYRILTRALIKKTPLPPKGWSMVKLDEEVFHAGREYDPDLHSRHKDALATSVFYLVDFARRMPEWINLSTTNERVREMCGELADEIEQITYEPESVIARHGKLKVWLKAKLAVQTCLIYRAETERNNSTRKKKLKTRLYILSSFSPPDAAWFVTEGEPNGDDYLFYGYVIGSDKEWGYFTLKQLEEINIQNLTVERDLYFKQESFSRCIERWKLERGG